MSTVCYARVVARDVVVVDVLFSFSIVMYCLSYRIVSYRIVILYLLSYRILNDVPTFLYE